MSHWAAGSRRVPSRNVPWAYFTAGCHVLSKFDTRLWSINRSQFLLTLSSLPFVLLLRLNIFKSCVPFRFVGGHNFWTRVKGREKYSAHICPLSPNRHKQDIYASVFLLAVVSGISPTLEHFPSGLRLSYTLYFRNVDSCATGCCAANGT